MLIGSLRLVFFVILPLLFCACSNSNSEDTTPSEFTLGNVNNVARGQLVTSPPITVSGISTSVQIDIIGGEYSINDSAFTSSKGVVNNGQTVIVQTTSSDEFDTTNKVILRIGNIDAEFQVTTFSADREPDPFEFESINNAQRGIYIESVPIEIKGINTPSEISITGGEFSISGSEFTQQNSLVSYDQSVVVRVESSLDLDSIKKATLNIGGVKGVFQVSTSLERSTKQYEQNFLSGQGFGVVIGDSIAQGAPAKFSRLQTEAGALGKRFDENYPNEYGQLSHHLTQETGIYWFNHGIAGQTTSQVWGRWPRDVLAQTFDVKDGRGNYTLSNIPSYLLIHVGINDIFTDKNLDDIKENYTSMIESAQSVGITVIISTLGYQDESSIEKLETIQSLNDWIKQLELSHGVIVSDFFTWGYNALTQKLHKVNFADIVHPNIEGYSDYSIVVANAINAYTSK